jgi:hypothetical protein
MLHLKVCSTLSEFANSEVLIYTLLPQLNDCTDYGFLKNCNLEKEAAQCLSTLAKFFKVKKPSITSNFT